MRAAAVLASAILASALPASAASLTSSYTEVASCRVVDFQEGEFANFCAGPAGMAAVLSVADGQMVATFGPATRGKPDEVREGADTEMEPLGIGGWSLPFGERIEWVSAGGAPCAAVVRMDLEEGSRLVVSPIWPAAAGVTIVRGNEEARTVAAGMCADRRG